MIVQWNGEDLELTELSPGSWSCRGLCGGSGNLDLSTVVKTGRWFAFLWFFGTRTRFEVDGCDSVQHALDRLRVEVSADHARLGVALYGPDEDGERVKP